MGIRTKQECHETSISQKIVEICEMVPIVDWQLYPQNPQLSTSNNVSSLLQNIQVPELQFIYPGYSSFKFVLILTNSSPIEWFSVSNPKLNGTTLNVDPGENTDLKFTLQNVDLLPVGIVELMVKIQAIGIKNGVEFELENESIVGVLKLTKTDASGSTFTTNKDVFNLSYNLANNILSGDQEIIVYSKNEVLLPTPPFGLSVSKVDNSTTTSLFLNLTETSILEGNYNEQMILNADGKQKRVTINFAVINDVTQFYFSQDLFDYLLLFNENKIGSGVVDVKNPNNLTITLESFPTFLQSCTYQNGKITFESKSASQLGVGLFSGNIVLKAGDVVKNIFIKINVVEHIINDFTSTSYYFSLDKKQVQMTRVNPAAVKVYMKLDMFFIGYGKVFNETQTYQLPYFQNKVTFYPGDEVNDFFIKLRETNDFSKSFDAYQFAVVKMTFTEINAEDNTLDTFTLDNVRFAPGYKPKCFPFFTDFPIRRIFPKSRLAISTDLLNLTADVQKMLSLIGDMPRLGYISRTYLFNSAVFNSSTELMDLGRVKFLPVPGPQKTINIFWETHNLVFDWLSCAGDYELPKDFDHTISENVQSGSEEKFETKQTDNLQINTGWLLNEEVEMVDAILNSNFVIIQLPSKTVRAIPIGKKNSLNSSEEGFKSMMLEFKILQDER